MANWKKVIVSGSAAELASLSLDTALTVANGGTGASTLTDGGVLLGSGAGAVTALGQATDGQLVIGSTGADPQLATLTQGTGVTITNTAGGIEISAAGSGGTVTNIATAGTVNGLTLTGGPITNTGTITLGGTLANIANGALTNSTVSYGGVTVALGASDATPAFDLSDATSLPLGTGTTGTLATTRGGTNITTYSTGDILYASAANTLSKLNIGSTGEVLSVSAGGVVEWTAPTTGDITGLTEGAGISITSAAGPVPTVAVDYVGTDNIILEAQDLSASTIATTDKIMFSDGSNDVSFANVSDLPFTNNTGDITSISLAANSGLVGTSLTGPIPQLSASIAAFAAGAVDVATDSFAFLDATDGLTKKESIDDFIGLIDGNGLTATSGVLAVDYGNTANTAAQGNTAVSFLGTTNEVELSTNTFTTVGGGGSVTIGLPDNVTITNNLTVANNAIISGDLTVSGTASFTHSENLDIADKFITLASGSTPGGSGPSDGGFVIAQDAVGSTQVGEALGLNISAAGNGRWGITGSFSNNAGAIVPLDYLVAVRATVTSPGTTAPVYGGSTDGYGNMHVDTNLGDIYIYA